ncbi:hypothetical protein SIM22_06435 [Bacillus cereus group sp. BfR-BA-01363]|uniref:hypothetical protein n=1 Tax=Bacillus cereus group sp. BfR-BA-01363 TaxID=3094882 RepID=UPI0029C3716E|nr:hypothetical protein [Bacillus cereus group sp. BfR-BA-01363]MDX5853743.1 hypothetical protein [Bacillus cereus group sp. BfR-BA-01363]
MVSIKKDILILSTLLDNEFVNFKKRCIDEYGEETVNKEIETLNKSGLIDGFNYGMTITDLGQQKLNMLKILR